MNTDERMIELMTEIRDLVKEQRDDYREFVERSEASQAEIMAEQAKRVASVMRFMRIAMAVVLFYAVWSIVSALGG